MYNYSSYDDQAQSKFSIISYLQNRHWLMENCLAMNTHAPIFIILYLFFLLFDFLGFYYLSRQLEILDSGDN